MTNFVHQFNNARKKKKKKKTATRESRQFDEFFLVQFIPQQG